MSDPLVRIDQRGAVRTLTMNRPQVLNSFTTRMHAELHAALDNAAVRCVMITGAGPALDYLEGAAAFLDKRPPIFKDR